MRSRRVTDTSVRKNYVCPLRDRCLSGMRKESRKRGDKMAVQVLQRGGEKSDNSVKCCGMRHASQQQFPYCTAFRDSDETTEHASRRN